MRGEVLFNEVIVIMLFLTCIGVSGLQDNLLDAIHTNGIGILIALKSILIFVCVTLVSVVMGVFWGVLCSLYFKYCRFMAENPAVETLTILFFGFCGYVCSELAFTSGALSALVYSMTVGHYNFYNLSRSGQMTSGVFLGLLSLFCLAATHLFVGCYCWTFKGLEENYQWSWTFFVSQLLVVPFARVLSVALMAIIVKILEKRSKKWRLTTSDYVIFALGGTVKGSLAFALMFSVTAPSDPALLASFQITQSTLLFTCAFTTVVYGPLSKYLIYRIVERGRAQGAGSAPLDERTGTHEGASIVSFRRKLLTKHTNNRFVAAMQHFDEAYAKPALIYDYAARKDDILRMKEALKIYRGLLQGRSDYYQYFLITAKAELDELKLRGDERGQDASPTGRCDSSPTGLETLALRERRTSTQNSKDSFHFDSIGINVADNDEGEDAHK